MAHVAPLAWVDQAVIEEATCEVEAQPSGLGTLDRTPHRV
ncbi:hypothetical protein ACFVJM_33585 [Streptomyces virginiae]